MVWLCGAVVLLPPIRFLASHSISDQRSSYIPCMQHWFSRWLRSRTRNVLLSFASFLFRFISRIRFIKLILYTSSGYYCIYRYHLRSMYYWAREREREGCFIRSFQIWSSNKITKDLFHAQRRALWTIYNCCFVGSLNLVQATYYYNAHAHTSNLWFFLHIP